MHKLFSERGKAKPFEFFEVVLVEFNPNILKKLRDEMSSWLMP
jgi:hypothetical protein